MYFIAATKTILHHNKNKTNIRAHIQKREGDCSEQWIFLTAIAREKSSKFR
jgi:hypothetical protein